MSDAAACTYVIVLREKAGAAAPTQKLGGKRKRMTEKLQTVKTDTNEMEI